MRPIGFLIGGAFGFVCLPALIYMNENYEFAKAQIVNDGAYAASIALLVLFFLCGFGLLAIAALALPFRRTRRSALSIIFAFFCIGGAGSVLYQADPNLMSGLFGLRLAG